MPRYEAPRKPNLNLPCMTCGEVIRSNSYHTIACPGSKVRGRTVPDGLYQHKRCRVGSIKWYNSLGAPVKGFKWLFDSESDARYKRLYKHLDGMIEDVKWEEVSA